MMDGRKIAVVGGGVAGIVAAWLLSKQHDVTIFEKNNYLGGHTHTIEVQEESGQVLPVDTGFIVYNDRTYPHFIRFLSDLKVAGRDSEMSFAYWDPEKDFYYSGTTLNGLFAQRKNIFRSSFWTMLKEIRRFGRIATEQIRAGYVPECTLGEYLDLHGFSVEFIEFYILPMGSAIWSMSIQDMLLYPVTSFVQFLGNHGLLSFDDRPQWKTVVGGSWSYVKAFERQFKGNIILDAPLEAVWRDELGCRLKVKNQEMMFDHVVLACHADEALGLLKDPTGNEHTLLGAWKYSQNQTVLHRDIGALPPLRRAWASWNYRREENKGQPVTLTYYMNRLQGLQTTREYCVTLNSPRLFKKGSIIAEMLYHHPQYTRESLKSQLRLSELNSEMTSFCGSYFANGFHEDAVRSALQVGKKFGLSL